MCADYLVTLAKFGKIDTNKFWLPYLTRVKFYNKTNAEDLLRLPSVPISHLLIPFHPPSSWLFALFALTKKFLALSVQEKRSGFCRFHRTKEGGPSDTAYKNVAGLENGSCIKPEQNCISSTGPEIVQRDP
jgi:hypothetical protein